MAAPQGRCKSIVLETGHDESAMAIRLAFWWPTMFRKEVAP
jgi:hypothetical protein